MTTINDLITEAYKDINVIGEVEKLTDSQLTSGLRIINRLIDGFNTERLLPVFIQQELFPLVSGQQIYSIGAGGDFDTTRPTDILKANIERDNSSYSMIKYTYDQWMDIFNKGNSSEIPTFFYYEPAYPLGRIHLYYAPDETNSITIASEKQLTGYVIDEVISLAPGYERMFVYNLGKELLTRYPSEALGPLVIKNANDSLNDIRRLNTKNIMVEAQLDSRAYGNQSARGYFWND